jgi:predicted  nucleic acid-binding Zn-ribbon protein
LEAAKQASEDVELKKKQGESVIHEQEPKKNNTAAKDNGVVEESADLDPYQMEVQRIKDIMAGKYDQF